MTQKRAGDILSALKRLQLPLPGVTIGPEHQNWDLNPEPGSPVFFGMTGAGSDSSYVDNLPGWNGEPSKYNFMNPSNTRLYRWIDRERALREMKDFIAKHPMNPVYAFGESYGGTAMSDVVGGLGSKIQGLVMYDPVAHNGAPAPKNLETPAVNIQPSYNNEGGRFLGNAIATIGGRREKIENAMTTPYYGRGTSPETTTASHYYTSANATTRALLELERKRLASKALDGILNRDTYEIDTPVFFNGK